jgi:transposase
MLRHIFLYAPSLLREEFMPKRRPIDAKLEALREHDSLNPRPQAVRDPLFHEHEFFDARDLVQVKYEMLRRASVDGKTVRQAATDFGCSRPSFYQARNAFTQAGLPGLVPRKRGPRKAHKLSDEILDFLLQAKTEQPTLNAPALAELIEQKFGVTLHPRTIERGIERRGKKAR